MGDASAPTIVAGLVARALHTAEACGLQRDALLEELGIHPDVLQDRDNRIPVETFARLWNLMSARLPNRVLALDWITSWTITDAGVLGYVMLQLQTVEEAMQASVRYAHLVNQGAQARLRKGAPTSRMGFELSPVLLATQHVAETMMASLMLFLRAAAGMSFSPVAVRFPHPST